MRYSKKLLSLVLTSALAVSISTSASAASNEKVATDKSKVMEVQLNDTELQNLFDKNNVPKEKQVILRKKAHKGELWDCYDPEKLKLVPEDFSYFDINDTIKEKTYRFEDGSFIKTSITPGESKNITSNAQLLSAGIKTTNNITTNSIVRDSFGALYTNYKVQRIVGATGAYFYANFYVANPYYGGTSVIYTSNDGNGYNSPYGENAYE